MRSNTSLLGRVLLWIAYGSTSKLESWTKSLTKMKSEVWCLKAEGVAFIILRKSFSVCSVCSVDKNFRAIRVRKFRNLKENVLESQETYRNVWLIFGDVVSLLSETKKAGRSRTHLGGAPNVAGDNSQVSNFNDLIPWVTPKTKKRSRLYSSLS